MKKIILIMVCVLTMFILSCGGGESGGESCTSNFDCPFGKVCSKTTGTCVTESSADDGSGEGGLTPDGENGNDGGSSGGNDDGEPGDDSDSAETDDPASGDCTPGQTRDCEYQGDPATENVGPCKAATSTCKEDGKWGKCEGAVEPVPETGEELCNNKIDDDCDGFVDNGVDGICSFWNDSENSNDSDNEPADSDPSVIDVGYTGDYDDAYVVPGDAEICADTCVPMKAECYPNDLPSEAAVDLCNGLDDDCDGTVDEGCPCSAGQTQPCFSGPPNFRNIGKCTDGVQTCKVTMRGTRSVGVWGDCVGGISPSLDVCDHADNNCNGCTDDKLCCEPPIDCSYDIGTASPFADKIIDGTQIYDKSHEFNDADTATWEWTLTKGPCDIVLGTTSFQTKGATTAAGLSGDGAAKNVVSGVGLSHFKVKFLLSGSYKLHLKVTRPNGEVHECEWKLEVVSSGLRIELCWDTNSSVDVDLHLGKNGVTSSWTDTSACYYGDCKGNPEGSYDDHSYPNWKVSGWGYENTDNYNKQGHLVKLPNPRLDIDNIADGPTPENINLDNPNDNDVFRVGVKYFSGGSVLSPVITHPVINVYCGGALKATYGVEPQVSGFTASPYFWKVVEIKWVGDVSSTECELTPKWNNGYVVTTSVPGYTSW